jgi:hypothetical protein
MSFAIICRMQFVIPKQNGCKLINRSPTNHQIHNSCLYMLLLLLLLVGARGRRPLWSPPWVPMTFGRQCEVLEVLFFLIFYSLFGPCPARLALPPAPPCPAPCPCPDLPGNLPPAPPCPVWPPVLPNPVFQMAKKIPIFLGLAKII